jgi:predicted ATPase
MVPYFIALQAQIEVRAGDPGAALLLLEAAQARMERTNERWYAAEVLRLQGEVLLQLGEDRVGHSRDRLSAALETARDQDARFWELRAALSLVRAGCPAPGAREQLALIYSGFTEGLTLPDLQAAQTLATTAEGLRAAN